MLFRLIFTFLILCISGLAYATNTLESGPINYPSSELNSNYSPTLDPRVGCNSWGWWCDIKFGLKNAESSGVNGVMINGYAYHLTVNTHLPTGYSSDGNVNELALGAGYTRTYYNPQYNSEYSLYAMGFMDSYYKPEIHIGYIYQHYFDLTDSGHLKWGLGYSPFVFIKPSLTNDAPLPIPAAGVLTSLKYYNVDVMLTYANVLFLNARVDF